MLVSVPKVFISATSLTLVLTSDGRAGLKSPGRPEPSPKKPGLARPFSKLKAGFDF